MENQLSRWGAISKILPDVAPYAKVFFVGDSDDTGFVDFVNEFPTDKDGVVRVYSSVSDSTMLANTRADRGDVILVMPGHSETLSAEVDYSTAGVKIIGLGSGDNRPTLTITGDTGVKLTGAGTRFSNFIVRAGGASLSHGIYVGAAGVEIDKNTLIDNGTTTNYFDQWISGDSADRANIHDNEILWTGADTAAVVTGIVFNDSPFVKIQRNHCYGDFPVAGIELDSDVSDGCLITHNYVNNQDTDGVPIRIRAAANTGTVAYNNLATNDTVELSAAGIVEGATKWIENYMVNDTAETGAVVPITASST